VCVGVLEGTASCRQLAVYRAFQMMVPEIIITGPHCLCVWSVSASNARVETCVGARYCTISGQCDIAMSTNLRSISRYRIIDMNPK